MSGSDDENSVEEEETENVIDDDLIEVDVEETVITTTEKRSRVGRLATGSIIWLFFKKGIEDAKCTFCTQVVRTFVFVLCVFPEKFKRFN